MKIFFRFGFAVCLILFTTSCAPRATSTSKIVELATCEPPVITQESSELSQAVAGLDASANQNIQNLESTLYELDTRYSCGILVDSDLEKSVLVYTLSVNSTSSTKETSVKTALDALSQPSTTYAVVLNSKSGDFLSGFIKQGSNSTTSLASSPDKVQYFSQLGKSNRSFTLGAGSRSTGSSQSSSSDFYNCSDFSSQAAAQAFFASDLSDPNRLDADNDGKACEWFDSRTYTKRTITVTRPVTRTYSSSSSNSGKCYVNGYTRKDGTRVKGYYRKC